MRPVKAARRTPRRRKALLPSGEKIHTRLSLVEQEQGLRDRGIFVFMPLTPGAPQVSFAEGEAPERGDILIHLPALCETGETLESFLATQRPKTAASAPVLQNSNLPWKHLAEGRQEADAHFPKVEFGSSTTGTLIVSVRQFPGDPGGRWRQATDDDREQWADSFEKYMRQCLANFSGLDGSSEAEHPSDDEDTR